MSDLKVGVRRIRARKNGENREKFVHDAGERHAIRKLTHLPRAELPSDQRHQDGHEISLFMYIADRSCRAVRTRGRRGDVLILVIDAAAEGPR